jgi:sugar lactone lactonase YvrE
MSRSMIALSAALGVSATLLAQAPLAPRALPGPKRLWTISIGLAAPESAYYHESSNSIFVSNINGQVLEKDGNGYITRIAPSGRVLADKWATGLNAPKGIRSIGNTIWVADIDEVVGFEVAGADGGRLVSRVKVEGSQFLNDLATAPDGTIYVSDSNQARIYMVKDGKVSVFLEAADVGGQPNGLLVDGNRLIVGTLGPGAARSGGGKSAGGTLMAFDLKTKVRTLVTTEPVGAIDGIEAAENGGLLVTDVAGRRLLRVYPTGRVVPLIAFEEAGADFGYIPVTVTRPTALSYGPVAVVPLLLGNSVSAYALDTSVGGR